MKNTLFVFAYFLLVMAYKGPVDPVQLLGTLVLLLVSFRVLHNLYLEGHYKSRLNILRMYRERIKAANTPEELDHAFHSFLTFERGAA